jgi:hypothetical protein
MSNMGKQPSPDLKRAAGAVDLGAANFQFKRAVKAARTVVKMTASGASSSFPLAPAEVG